MLFSDYFARRPRLLGEDLFSTPRSFQRAMDTFLQDVIQQQPLQTQYVTFSPMIDVDEDEKQVKLVAELPGLSENDVEIVYEPGAIILRGEKKEEQHRDLSRGRGRYEERRYGAFERRIQLACEVEEEQIQAHFDRGVLTVTIPKSAEARAQAKKIPIKTGAAQLEQATPRAARGQPSSEGTRAAH